MDQRALDDAEIEQICSESAEDDQALAKDFECTLADGLDAAWAASSERACGIRRIPGE